MPINNTRNPNKYIGCYSPSFNFLQLQQSLHVKTCEREDDISMTLIFCHLGQELPVTWRVRPFGITVLFYPRALLSTSVPNPNVINALYEGF